MYDQKLPEYSTAMGYGGLVVMVVFTSILLVAGYAGLGMCLIVEANQPLPSSGAIGSQSSELIRMKNP
jgi:hypothetical protein